MNGIFGGLLGLIDSMGGAFLYILIGGSATKSSMAARLVRLLFGALIFGCGISVLMYFAAPAVALEKLPFQNLSNAIGYAPPLLAVPPIVITAFTALVELLRFGLEGRYHAHERHSDEHGVSHRDEQHSRAA